MAYSSEILAYKQSLIFCRQLWKEMSLMMEEPEFEARSRSALERATENLKKTVGYGDGEHRYLCFIVMVALRFFFHNASPNVWNVGSVFRARSPVNSPAKLIFANSSLHYLNPRPARPFFITRTARGGGLVRPPPPSRLAPN